MIVSLFSGLCISNLSVVFGKAEFLTFRFSSEAVAKRMECNPWRCGRPAENVLSALFASRGEEQQQVAACVHGFGFRLQGMGGFAQVAISPPTDLYG
jgi:hypothetical protein